MIFLSAAVFAICFRALPWWCIWIAATALGFALPSSWSRVFTVAFIAAIVNVAMAFVQDGMNFGMIAPRMSALFGLPFGSAIYLVMALITFISAALGFSFGQSLRRLV